MSAPEANDPNATKWTRAEIKALLPSVVARAPRDAVKILAPYPDEFIVDMLILLNPSTAYRVLERFPSVRRQKIMAAAAPAVRQQWVRNEYYPDNTIGHMMQPALAVFGAATTVADATRDLRDFVQRAFITYLFVVDEAERLLGVVAMREMLFARPDQRLDEIMIARPFFLIPETPLLDAMKATMLRHYPVYPVCERNGKIVGLIRGQMLFEAETLKLSLQAGSMVGVEKEERLSTPWLRSLRFRHPWLQGNLFAGFVAAAVVGYFQGTIDRVVVLAVFLPVILGQSSNTGVQTLAVALRGMTLGELAGGHEFRLILKETFLGLLNGALTGLTAAAGMFVFATSQRSPLALQLSFVVFFAMAASCLITGLFGVSIPLIFRKIGTDPATASGIVLSTASDVVTLSVFLGLATWLL